MRLPKLSEPINRKPYGGRSNQQQQHEIEPSQWWNRWSQGRNRYGKSRWNRRRRPQWQSNPGQQGSTAGAVVPEPRPVFFKTGEQRRGETGDNNFANMCDIETGAMHVPGYSPSSIVAERCANSRCLGEHGTCRTQYRWFTVYHHSTRAPRSIRVPSSCNCTIRKGSVLTGFIQSRR